MINVDSKLKAWLIGSAIAAFLAGCASGGTTQNVAAQKPAVATELPAPKKTILVFETDTNQAYEILGEIDAHLTDQRVYNVGGSIDQIREHLKRVAYAKYGDQLDAIVSYRVVTTVGGGSFWGQIGAAYGARNTDMQAKGVAVRFTGKAKK